MFTEFVAREAPDTAAETQAVPPEVFWANLLKLINHFPIGWATEISLFPTLVKVHPGAPIRLLPLGSVTEMKGEAIRLPPENSNLIE